nr:hypothetical protein [Lysinibacillus sphaericus]
MKKKIFSLITTFTLALVCLIIFNDNANASTIEDENMINSTNASITGWEEYFRFDNESSFSANKKWIVQVRNVSFEGGEYMVRFYKPGTTTVIFEKSGYIGPKSNIEHDYMTNSTTIKADMVWYRQSGSGAEILGNIWANRD